jgi:hypothetical protein
MNKQACSFLKKRTKKLLFALASLSSRKTGRAMAQTNEVFLLLFLQKKKVLPL